jgi:3-hydroxyisobutyrate dehydrogenase
VAEVMRGLLPALRPGAVVVDMGSSVPAQTRRLAAEAAARGAAMIDAPVSGSVVKARAGTLAIMVGGADAAFARAEPVLRDMGEAILRTGPVGSAHAMKALNNYVYAAGLLATAEAVDIGARLGLDLGVLAEVLNASSGRNVATETKLRQEILSGRYAGGFQLGLMRKDLDTAGAVAAEAGVEARALALCRAVWAEAVAALGPGVDNTEVHRFLAKRGEPQETR